MSDQTKIEWADSTWSAWEGCTKVGPGCDNCYAENRDNRFGGGHWGPGAPRKPHTDAYWRKPLKWNRESFIECAACGWRGERSHFNHGENPVGASMCPVCACGDFHPARRRVFCASLSDWLDNEAPIEWLVDLLDLIRRTPNLDWLQLTKRIGNWQQRLEEAHVYTYAEESECDSLLFDWVDDWLNGKPPGNVWLGATVVDQKEADRDVVKLMQVPARVRFLSVEPMLGEMDLSAHLNDCRCGACDYCLDVADHPTQSLLHWIICGGESGPHARPIHPDWARSLRDQCEAAGVPFLFKQWGEYREFDTPGNEKVVVEFDRMTESEEAWVSAAHRPCFVLTDGSHFDHPQDIPFDQPGRMMERVGKKAAGNLLDGRQHLDWPVCQ